MATQQELSRQAEIRHNLIALEEMFTLQYELIRWRFILANLPPSGMKYVRGSAERKIVQLTGELESRRLIVWRAIGYDAEADPPPPERHWDRTEMES
jgi:hypothetical protein